MHSSKAIEISTDSALEEGELYLDDTENDSDDEAIYSDSEESSFFKKMSADLEKEPFDVIKKVNDFIVALNKKIESQSDQKQEEILRDLEYLCHSYATLELAYLQVEHKENAERCKVTYDRLYQALNEKSQFFRSKKQAELSGEMKAEEEEIKSSSISTSMEKIFNLTENNKHFEALEELKKLRKIIPKDDIYSKIFCLRYINKNFHDSKQIITHRQELTENFLQMIRMINKNSESLKKQRGIQLIKMIDDIYYDHLKIFYSLSKLGANSSIEEIESFSHVILCGVNGLKVNKNSEENRKRYIVFLNQFVSKKYNIPILSKIEVISDLDLAAWEKTVNEKIHAEMEAISPLYLYEKSFKIVNDSNYILRSKESLEKALKEYDDKKDLKSKINKIKATILLARCYDRNDIADASGKFQSAINQMAQLEEAAGIPELWSLRLERGLSLLNENDDIDHALKEFKKVLADEKCFQTNNIFFSIDPVSVLQALAKFLHNYTLQTSLPFSKESLELFLEMLIKFNEKAKDSEVADNLEKAKNELIKLKKSFVKINKKESGKTTVKPEKKPAISLKQPILKKTLEQIKAEKEQEEELRKKEQARQTWAKVKAQREQEETQKKLEEARQALAKIKEEAEAKKREAFRLRQIDKQKNKNKDEGISQHELEGTPVPLSDKQQRRLQREKEKPTSSISSSIALGRGNGAKGFTKKPKSTGKKKVPGKTKQERDEEFRAEEEATRKMRIAQQQKAAEALAKEEKVKEEKQRENTEKYKVEESHRLEMLKQKQEETRKSEEARRLEIEKLEKEAEERRKAEEEARRLEMEKQEKEAEERRKAEEEARRLEMEKQEKEAEERRKAEEEARRLEMEKQEKEAEERRKAEEEARRLEMEKQEKAMAEKRKTEKKEEKNIVAQVHSGLIDVALALHHKKDPHKAIDDNAILKQLKELNDKLKTNPLLKDLKLELIIQGTAVLEFYLARKKGEKINFDASDLDLFIYNAPRKHTAKKHKKLTEAEKKENEAYNQLQTILTASGFNRLVRKHDSHHFSNYTHAEHPKLQLTVAHDTYQSNDPFYFTRGRIHFSDKDGLELVNPKELASTEEMMLECDLVKADSPNIVNFFSRLLKYYEKGQNNNFKFGKNFIKALENPWQFHFFLTKYNEGEQHSNYLEMQSVIKSGFLDTQKTLPKTFAAAKGLLSAFCEAAYYAKFKAKIDIGLCSLIRDLLIIYYANKGSNPELLLSDLNCLMNNKNVFYQPFIYKALTTYYAKEDTGQISLHSDLQFLTQQGIQPQHSSVEYLVSELERKNNPAKFMKNYSMNEDFFAQEDSSVPLYSLPPVIMPQSSVGLGMFPPPSTRDLEPMPLYSLAQSIPKRGLLVRTSVFSPTATTISSTPTPVSAVSRASSISPRLNYTDSSESE